ncbi:MAG: NAD(P)-binding domain-containing protein, partial [Proteobacteria bacterium]|nr:NAD(P)-binding domain-containing protein [Pseudomonadota bacterium]
MSEHQNLGFIGAGNMATALIKGLIESGVYDRQHLSVADKDKDALERGSGNFGVKCHASNLALTSDSSIIVLAIKPQNMREVLEEIKGEIRDDHLIISIAAGIPLRM